MELLKSYAEDIERGQHFVAMQTDSFEKPGVAHSKSEDFRSKTLKEDQWLWSTSNRGSWEQ